MEWLLLFIIGIGQRFVGTLAGSGGLISFPAMLLLGYPVHAAIAANKMSTTIGSFSGFLTLVKEKKADFRQIVQIAPLAVIGGLCGGWITAVLSESTLKGVTVILLMLAFGLSFLKKKEQALNGGKHRFSKKLYGTIFATSLYNGAFGPGQGTILMQLLLRDGIPYLFAIGLKQISTFVSGAAAAVVFIVSGDMLWTLAIPLTLGSVVGAQLALKVARYLSGKQVQWILRGFMVLLIAQVVIELVRG
ncbi:MAG TPA: sulfite exporter TauE/SafE family protein [Bacillales bacterium]|nr:sulfite exporter TauE/SafE family protein [Bacillales bacterium]